MVGSRIHARWATVVVVLVLVALGVGLAASRSEAAPQTLEAFIQGRMERARVPAVSVAAVRDGEVVWARAFGEANVGTEVAATPETAFLLASISKTFTATAVMQLVEDGTIGLDDPVSDIVDFDVENPRFGGALAITVRQLLAHTSSISDSRDFLDVSYAAGDFPVPLGTVMRGYFTPGGQYWSERQNFARSRPGKRRRYSNVAYGLLGHVVEAADGRSLERYSQEEIFGPLGMTNTSWFLAGVDEERLAMPTRWDRRGRRFVSYGQYGFADYPSGQLRTTAAHTARFFATLLRGGTSVDGVELLKPETVELMKTRAFRRAGGGYYGLGLVRARVGGLRLYGHDGAEDGVNTYAFFRRDGSAGAVVLANGDAARRSETGALESIVRRLVQEAEGGLVEEE